MPVAQVPPGPPIPKSREPVRALPGCLACRTYAGGGQTASSGRKALREPVRQNLQNLPTTRDIASGPGICPVIRDSTGMTREPARSKFP